jgi:endoglucanase
LNVLSGHLLRRATFVAGVALVAGALGAMPIAASAAPVPSGHTLAPNTHFYVPPPAQGSTQQALQLLLHGQVKDAALIADMEATPQAVWLTGETSAQAALPGNLGSTEANLQVEQQVRQALFGARLQNAVPIFVAYNIPGRDCSQYSAGGAPSDPAYDTWIQAISSALGNAQAVVLEEPDGLANLPGYCASSFPDITNTTRIDDISYAVTTLESDPNISLYLDAGHSAWQNVGGMAETLVAANVQHAQGFFLDVSNYQYATNNVFYGTWTSSCIAYATVNKGVTQAGALANAANFVGAANVASTDPFSNCSTQYWNGGPPNTTCPLGPWYNCGVALSPYGVWSETAPEPTSGSGPTGDLWTAGIDSQYATLLGSTVPTTHFIVDTSRDGQRPNDMEAYYAAPYDQPQSVVGSTPGVTYPNDSPPAGSLQNGNWCNPPSSGTGILPTANTSTIPNSLDSYLPSKTSLLDAYLWVKTPGQSDGQCDLAGGVRNWQDGPPVGVYGYTPPITGWPASTAAAFNTFDPLWSLQTNSVFTDPAAGVWFPQQALQLAENANPALNFPFHT